MPGRDSSVHLRPISLWSRYKPLRGAGHIVFNRSDHFNHTTLYRLGKSVTYKIRRNLSLCCSVGISATCYWTYIPVIAY
jgi:hypothetical protein